MHSLLIKLPKKLSLVPEKLCRAANPWNDELAWVLSVCTQCSGSSPLGTFKGSVSDHTGLTLAWMEHSGFSMPAAPRSTQICWPVQNCSLQSTQLIPLGISLHLELFSPWENKAWVQFCFPTPRAGHETNPPSTAGYFCYSHKHRVTAAQLCLQKH